jgi:protein-S-isoprenylcysteine O-methyltransferase Ste14
MGIMMMTESAEREGKSRGGLRARLRLILGILVLLLYILALFLLAGRWDWVQGWVFIGLILMGQTSCALFLRRKSPELLRRRARIGEGTKPWDKVWLAGFMVLYLAIPCVAALDAGRYGWSRMSPALWPVGAGLYIVFLAFVTWAMAENPFFEKTVRIQHDRNHRVVDTGPYRFLRHPGYTGVILSYILPPPLLLGSWWALVPAGVTTGWFVLRTALEDRTLRKELDGYEEYANRVRYRLIPFVW